MAPPVTRWGNARECHSLLYLHCPDLHVLLSDDVTQPCYATEMTIHKKTDIMRSGVFFFFHFLFHSKTTAVTTFPSSATCGDHMMKLSQIMFIFLNIGTFYLFCFLSEACILWMRKKHSAVCFVSFCVYEKLLKQTVYFHSSEDGTIVFSKCLFIIIHCFFLFFCFTHLFLT